MNTIRKRIDPRYIAKLNRTYLRARHETHPPAGPCRAAVAGALVFAGVLVLLIL